MSRNKYLKCALHLKYVKYVIGVRGSAVEHQYSVSGQRSFAVLRSTFS